MFLPAAKKLLSHRNTHLIIICVATIITYQSLISAEFINLDDGEYVYDNIKVKSGLSAENILWPITATELVNWHPVTWWSHMLAVEMFGLWAGGHHLINIMLHLIVSVLVYLFCRRLGINSNPSLFIAIIFVIHPSHVESVAWISERKDMLCALFWLLALNNHISARLPNSKGRHALTYLYFLLGLASKPMIVTFPFTLILVDYYLFLTNKIKHNPLNSSETLKWLIIYSVPVVAVSLITMIIQGGAGDVVSGTYSVIHMYNAAYNYVWYILHFLYPIELSLIYIYQETTFLKAVMSIIIILLMAAFSIKLKHREPYLVFGLLWYVITLFPVSGVIEIGYHSIADRYLYIPSLGLIIALTLLSVKLLSNQHSYYKFGIAATLVISLMAQSINYTHHWNNGVSLYLESINNRGHNPVLYYKLYEYFIEYEMYAEADYYIDLFIASPSTWQEHTTAWGYTEKALIMYRMNRKKEALSLLRRALAVEPNYKPAQKLLTRFLEEEYNQQ